MYIVPEENSLYVRHNNGYLQYTQSNDSSQIFIDGTKVQREPINNSFPVHATTADGANTWMCQQFHTTIPTFQDNTVSSFDSYICQLDDWDSLLLQQMRLHKLIHIIAQIWQSGSAKLIMASNESSGKEENIMTFGWKIVDKNESPLVEHSGPAFGKATSFHAE
eukprot:3536496-Ditylum_brightwellii.AAC.1